MLTDDQLKIIEQELKKKESGGFLQKRKLKKKKRELRKHLDELDSRLLDWCNSVVRKDLSEVDSHINSINRDTIKNRKDEQES